MKSSCAQNISSAEPAECPDGAAGGRPPSAARVKILLAEDEPLAREGIRTLLVAEGFDVVAVTDGRSALEAIEVVDPDVVLADIHMPRLDGLALLEQGRLHVPHAVFLVMTAFGSVDTAVQAMKQGAEDYVTKPLDVERLLAHVRKAAEKARLRREAVALRRGPADRLQVGPILGEHPSMQRLLRVVAQVAPTRATVLIQGESGTGKELVAAAIHRNSPRSGGPFVRLNCAALNEALLESELFGHERGAFTGALGRRQGRFEQAHGGTLFLDEVGEISAATQVKLLRFLQEREFERVGGNEVVAVDVRVVAATNRGLYAEVEAGRFREDLYYRLNVVQLQLPPLRARRSDIPLLAHHFLERCAESNACAVHGFTEEALQHMMTQPWPGNVRQLSNVVERAVVLALGPTISVQDLQAPHLARRLTDLDALVPGISMTEVERIVIERTLHAVNGSTSRAAELLGISQRKIQYRLKQWEATAER